MTFLDEIPRPEAARAPRYNYDKIAEDLKGHPGKWLLVHSHPKGGGGGWRSNILSALRGRGAGFEVVSRIVDDNMNVYARWVKP